MTTQPRPSGAMDALALLKTDHERVEEMFASLAKTSSKKEKAELVDKVCMELAIHAAVEEQVFYPAVGKEIGDGDLVGEAMVEHGEAKHLIGLLGAMDPSDPLYGPTVQVLSEYVRHHVAEEQDKMFPKVKKAKLDLTTLGEAILKRKEELLAEAEAKGIEPLLAPASAHRQTKRKQASGATH